MNLEMDRWDPFYEQVVGAATEKEVETWFNIEKDQGVQEAVLNDMFGENEEILHSAEKDSNVEQECDLEENEPLPLLTERSLLEPLSKLEEIAYQCNVKGAILYLRKARMAFMAAKRDEVRQKSRQLLVTEMLQPPS